MKMPGFTASNALYQRPRRQFAAKASEGSQGEVTLAGLFRYCDGWPPMCCTCDLTNGGCDCSHVHNIF